ncbi:MAG: DUF4982 domain-containing protein [Rikenellaceae bacterium]|nr:DUF4982 domain-containing protein [Rikenellaceae bacterium]
MRKTLLLALLLLAALAAGAQGRLRTNIDFDWRFLLGDPAGAERPGFDDSAWRLLDLPHDWSIEGTYDEHNPGGGQMGFLPGGTGWYRKTLDWNPAWEGRKVSIEFDGVYMNSQVWINGRLLGLRPYGYIPFAYDLTPYLVKGPNTIAVRVDHYMMPSARWYTGSGIYRHVHLTATDPLHVARNGVTVRTPQVSATRAVVNTVTEIENESGRDRRFTLTAYILDAAGRVIARQDREVAMSGFATEIPVQLVVPQPKLWSPETPEVYYLQTVITDDERAIDTYTTRFGIRSLEFTPGSGFRLNGTPTKLKGVCIHQDASPAGTAVPEDVLHRRLKLLKEMGCNAIRTTHHPFAEEFYAMCDTMGFMVMNEAFDGWYHWDGFAKARWDYGLYWLEWWERDLTEFVRRDRNCPSVIMWSLGNEIWGYDRRLNFQKRVNDLYHRLDPTRPTTQAWALGEYIDIAGFNANGESQGDLAAFHREKPGMLAVGTEIPHTRQTRGVYRTRTSYNPWDQPDLSGHEASAADRARLFPLPDLSAEEVFPGIDPRYASGYDNQTRKISAREQWKQTRDNDFFIGEFRWTGFDYLGEAWSWPARTNNYGIIDLAGFPKDSYYLYQSFWSARPMVHLLPHWTWPDKEGETIPVVVYTNCDEAELRLNGRSLGRRAMSADTLQMVWQVPYKPGRIEAIAYNDGRAVARKEVRTAGAPDRIALSADRASMQANRRDVVHVVVDITDKKGIFNPAACDTVRFEVTGPYKLLGVENGDILDMSPHKVLKRRTFMGKALLMLQATGEPGTLTVRATGAGLQPAEITIPVTTPAPDDEEL